MDRTRNLRETQNREQFRYNLAGTATRAQMGMYAKLRHVPVTELTAAKKDPANFYRNLYSIQGTVDRRIMLQGLAGQIGEAIKGSPLAKEWAHSARRGFRGSGNSLAPRTLKISCSTIRCSGN